MIDIIALAKEKYGSLMELGCSYISNNLVTDEKISIKELDYCYKIFQEYIDTIDQSKTLLHELLKSKNINKKFIMSSNFKSMNSNNSNTVFFEIKSNSSLEKIKKFLSKNNKYSVVENYTNVFSLSIEYSSFDSNFIFENDKAKDVIKFDLLYGFYNWIKTQDNIDKDLIDKIMLSSSNNARLYVYDLLNNKSLNINDKVNLLNKIMKSNISMFESYLYFDNEFNLNGFEVLNGLIIEFRSNVFNIDTKQFKNAQMALLLLGSPQGIKFENLLREKELLSNYFDLFESVTNSLSKDEKNEYKNILNVFNKKESKYSLLGLSNNNLLDSINTIFNTDLLSHPILVVSDEILEKIKPEVTIEKSEGSNVVFINFNINNWLNYFSMSSSNNINAINMAKNISNTITNCIRNKVLHSLINEENTVLNNDLISNFRNNSLEYILAISDNNIYEYKDVLEKNIKFILGTFVENYTYKALAMIKNSNVSNKYTYAVRDFGQNLKSESLSGNTIISEALSGKMGANSELDQINYIMSKIKENNLRDLIDKTNVLENSKLSERRKKI